MNGDHINSGEDDAADDFWGSTPDWSGATRRPRRERAGRTDVTGAIKGLWNAAMSSGADATRQHRVVDATTPRPEAHDARIDTAMFDDLDTELPLWSSGRNDVVRAEPVRADTFAAEPVVSRPVDERDERPVLDPTTEVPVIDAAAPEPDEGFAEMTPVSMLERDETTKRERAAIDPLLVRIGAVAIVTTLLVPLMLGLTSDGADEGAVTTGDSLPAPGLAAEAAADSSSSVDVATLDPNSLPPAVPVNPPATADDDTTASAADVSTTSASESAADAVEATSDEANLTTSSAATETAAETTASEPPTSATSVDAPASAGDDAERVQTCAIDYEVQPGDFWIRLAEGAGVPLAEILEANGASASTSLYPGTTICLPAGSSTPPPPPPPATAAPTTQAPTTTAAPTTTTTTTTTTVAPAPAGPEEIEQIIRDVWPDDLEDRALTIAYRESRYVPTAKNYCCYGLFQIYWNVHKGWLTGLGVTSDQQLFDPETNARAAYALYQRSGGWGPWSQTAY